MGPDDCIFCSLLAGVGRAEWMLRESGADAAALLPLPDSCLAPGHTLVIPTEHCVGVQDASPLALHAVNDLVQRVAQAMTSALGAEGVNVLNASGTAAGQSVPHLHVHVVPRWAGDGLDAWPTGRSSHGAREDVRSRLNQALAARPRPDGI
ncbi:hypothetical protein DEO23_09480 [Brachybacterium endophyticum]|uniref:HIT domain-containing protein n=1 Tax=Brachybacterium endophyticum TaxID=2182385 RepID=A0A2U2RJI6_9MICO|nr:HIT domain-containing protein [Brachybacterium endophyticum]PWH06039.1 hypothetical protein DEO23_09480 [Brachybacterium endophyticum]